MSHFRGCCVATLVVAAILAGGKIALAETCTMELKRLGTGPSNAARRYRWSPQVVWREFGSNLYRRPDTDKEFRELVVKEPEKYVSKEPFRGVVKLGSGKFAFVLDAKDEKSEGYDRLYFDLNGNGNLTDEKPIDGRPMATFFMGVAPKNYSGHMFPRVDLTIPVDGKTMEYSFILTASSRGRTIATPKSKSGSKTTQYRRTDASFRAAAYREGEITLDGRKHGVVLQDYNGNGRFDDQTNILKNAYYPYGGIVAKMGDVLVIDPPSAGPNTGQHDQYVSKLAKIDEKYYEVKVSPTGDQLTLTPLTHKMGFVTNPNGPYSGMIYGDHGFLPIRGEPGKPVAVPEGQWKLLSCKIEVKGWKPPTETKKKDAEKDGQQRDAEPDGSGAKKTSSKGLLESITKPRVGPIPSRSPQPQPGPRGISSVPVVVVAYSSLPRQGPPGISSVDARGTEKCPAVAVRAGETVTLPFGPPYKPVVKAFISPGQTVMGPNGGEIRLSMKLVGSGEESVSSLLVDGYGPNKLEFTITDPRGELVQKGSFKYVSGFPCRYSWRVTSKPAEEYHVRVQMDAGPFQIDPSALSVIKIPVRRPIEPERP